jgi:hypothetical protein
VAIVAPSDGVHEIAAESDERRIFPLEIRFDGKGQPSRGREEPVSTSEAVTLGINAQSEIDAARP